MDKTNNINKIINASWTIFPLYVNIMTKYLIHFTSTEKYKKGENDIMYLLLNGVATLTHVFKIILRETLNVAEADEKTTSAIFYYTQCIEQMEESKTDDLDIYANIASVFVYKKTIPTTQLNGEVALSATKEDLLVIKNVEELIYIYKKVLDILIEKNYSNAIPDQLMNISIELCTNANSATNAYGEPDFQRDLQNVIDFIHHFPSSKKNLYDYIFLFIKKYKEHPINLSKVLLKRMHSSYKERLNDENINNYIKWLLAA